MTTGLRTLRVAALLALTVPARAVDPYGRLADSLSAAARGAGVRRVAVLPFRAPADGDKEGGLTLAERLVERLVTAEGVTVVERTRLEAVLAEQSLGAAGALEPRHAVLVGRVLGAEAVVTGTFVPLSGGRVEVHARLIDAGSARVIGASAERVAKEWEEDLMPVRALWDVRPPGEQGRSFPAPLVRLVPDPFRDAPNDLSCTGWEEEVERLQEETLQLKARFWAARLRDPDFSLRALTRNPGSEIRSLAMRQEFYALLRRLHREGGEPLERAERDTLEAADRRVAEVVERCY